jgi:hypothetical protein
MKVVALALLLAAAVSVNAGLNDSSVPYVGCFNSKHFSPVKKEAKTVEECIKECEKDKLPLVGMVNTTCNSDGHLNEACHMPVIRLAIGMKLQCSHQLLPRELR